VRAAPPRGTAPDVQLGCETNGTDECTRGSEGVAQRENEPFMRLAVGRPSDEWTSGLRSALDGTGAERALMLTLEVGQYWTRQRNDRGDKEVQLGTSYSVGVPWLTSLDTPVSVLQLTGALIGRDGKAIRIGGEGLLARRTPLLASAVGAQALLRDEDVERARTARRDDLPGRPLVWQVAMRNLVAELTGHSELAVR
jgi:hypothetical protein